MKPQFVATSNYRRFTEAVQRIEARGAREACHVLVSGPPGRGKTRATEAWAASNSTTPGKPGVIYLRANSGWTPNAFLRALAAQLGIYGERTADGMFSRVFVKLGELDFPKLVIDEVQNCLHDRGAVLERLRDITDRTASVAVLVAGEGGVLDKISRYPQIASRIAENVEFELATVEDVALMCKQLAEVEIKSDLAAQIHREAKGVLRPVMNAIATVEGMAKTSGLKSVDAAQLKASGAVLCINWQSGSKLVRAA
jgi:DNA transposition AAA+ family ATPase